MSTLLGCLTVTLCAGGQPLRHDPSSGQGQEFLERTAYLADMNLRAAEFAQRQHVAIVRSHRRAEDRAWMTAELDQGAGAAGFPDPGGVVEARSHDVGAIGAEKSLQQRVRMSSK